MSSDESELISRKELLSSRLPPSRRASLLLFAIESRTAHLVAQSQRAAAMYLTGGATERRERAFLESLAASRDLPLRPTIQDLELYAPHWAILVSEASANLRAALARLLGKKYIFTREAVPGVRKVLGLDGEAVRQAYQNLYGAPLETIYVPQVALVDRLRWGWTVLAKWLDALPPFWIAFVLTLIIGGVTLALPIAAAGIGALPSIVLVIVFGLLNMVTISAMAETVTRSGALRYGDAFIGQVVADYLGNASSTILSTVLTAFSFGLLLIFYLGISTTLEGATRLPAEAWMVFLFLVGLYFLSRGSLNVMVAFTMVITAVNLALLLVISLLAFTHLSLDNLLYVNIPLMNDQPFDPSLLSSVIGVIMGLYSAHILVAVFGKMILQRSPSGRALTQGHAAGISFATIINVIWILAVNGAVTPQVLADQPGTALVPLIAQVGPVVGVLGAIFVILSMGLGLIQFSLALFNLVHERLSTRRATALGQRGRFLISLSPVLVVFLVAEWLSFNNQGSFAGLLGLLGILVDSLMGGIFPILLLVASRRKGELVPQVVYRFLGHPALTTGVYLFYLFNLLFHGLVIWQDPVQRVVGTLVGLLMLGVTLHLIRKGGFAPRLVIELREDQRQDGQSLFAVTAGGQPAVAEVWLSYEDGEQHVQTATDEIPAFASLRRATFQPPTTKARELKVWTHKITPEGDSESLPARVEVRCGDEREAVDLELFGGQVVLPLTGEACRLEIVLPDRSARNSPYG